MHDIALHNMDIPLNAKDAAQRLSKDHGIRIYITPSALNLALSISALSSSLTLRHQRTLTFHYTSVRYSDASPAPPHISGFFVLLFTHSSCPFDTIWKPSPAAPNSSAPFPAPACYLSHIAIPPVRRKDNRHIPAALSTLSNNKILLHPSFYLYLLTSIIFPTMPDSYLHTIYDANPTYSMMLPFALTNFYWYLLPFTRHAPGFEYPAKDYATWAMHFLARSMDDQGLENLIGFYNNLDPSILTAYSLPPSTPSARGTPQKPIINLSPSW